MCGVCTSESAYIQFIQIQLIIWYMKGLTAAILGTDFQRIKYKIMLSYISLNII